MKRFLSILLWAGIAVGCGNIVFESELDIEEATPEVNQTYLQSIIEPIDGYPSYDERLVLYFTNRSRTAPADFNPDEPFEPTPPLRYDLELGQAARWQARHIIEEDCWCQDHSSCCEVGEVDDEIQCIGPTTGCGVTGASARTALFSDNFSGENAGKGHPNPARVVNGWTFSSGHWQNMNRATHNLLGTGAFQGGWIQAFGRDSQPPPILLDGIHFSDGPNQRFGITYYQPSTGVPELATVVIEGQCYDLTLEHGEPDHGAYEAMRYLDDECSRYFFQFIDGNGDEHTFPPYGSFGVSPDTTEDTPECPFFSSDRLEGDCLTGDPDPGDPNPGDPDPGDPGETDSCASGDTRPCYTGPQNTADVGICKSGVQECLDGEWEDECWNEVLPEAAEICGNNLDDICSGTVDDMCDDEGNPIPNDDEGTHPSGDNDDNLDASPDNGDDVGEDISGCSLTTNSRLPAMPWFLWFIVIGFAIKKRVLATSGSKA